MAKIKLTREERLAQALRDNLRKRKAAGQIAGANPKDLTPNKHSQTSDAPSD